VSSLLKPGGYFIGITPDSSMIWYVTVIAMVISFVEKMFCSSCFVFVTPIHRLLSTLCFLRRNLLMLMLFVVYVEDLGAQLKRFDS